ncbi:MAG: penicillin-binding transpeptidase domain-containing protein, partial [Chloroflexota bacterium]
MIPVRRGHGGPGYWLTIVLAIMMVAACGRGGAPTPAPTQPAAQAPAPGVAPTMAPTAVPTVVIPTATVAPASPTPSADALKSAVDQYVQAWQGGHYADMYPMLSASAKASITQDKFVQRYTDITGGIDQISVSVTPSVPATVSPGSTSPVEVPYHVTYKLATLGDVSEDNQLPMVLENGAWKVSWTPGLIFKDLTADRLVRYDSTNPTRGSILDRNGNILAEDGPILTVGVVPGEIKDESAMLKALSDYLKVPPDQIKSLYASAQPDWFVPIKDLPYSDKATAEQKLGGVLGVSLRQRTRRVYPYAAATVDVVGYVSPATQADMAALHAKGYDVGDMVGRAGIEAWGEQYLAGQKGATLSILNQDNSLVRVIAQKAPANGDTIITSLDVNYQIQANKTLGDHAGSLIVMNPQDNTILAMASTPSFDPNLFVLGMTDAQWQQINGPKHPLLYRPAQGEYPTGSIFKVITMAAGLEKGVTKPSETFDCGLDWHGLPGVTLHNWKAEGTLNLIQGLTGSCDPTFYTIGLRLSQLDPNILPSFARAFGLGKSTQTSGVDDAPGLVPDPAWKQKTQGQPWYDGDGVNLAIGQGYLLATPLQMANVYSTIANHGTLRSPVLVTEIKGPDGSVVQSFSAKTMGQVPVSPKNLGYIVEGMRGVTSTPLGTTYYAW